MVEVSTDNRRIPREPVIHSIPHRCVGLTTRATEPTCAAVLAGSRCAPTHLVAAGVSLAPQRGQKRLSSSTTAAPHAAHRPRPAAFPPVSRRPSATLPPSDAAGPLRRMSDRTTHQAPTPATSATARIASWMSLTCDRSAECQRRHWPP